MRPALPISLLWILLASCAETTQAPELPPAAHWTRRDLVPKAEWIDRLLSRPDAPVDLVEAASVLTNSTRAEWRPSEEIQQSLSPVVDRVRKRTGPHPNPEATIAALNEILLPKLTDPQRPLLPWIYDVFRQSLGGCVPSSLIYLLAADRLSLPLEPVEIPGHVFLQLRTGSEVRRIETTDRGQHLSVDEYRMFLARLPGAPEPFPDDPALAEKLFLPLSRRQFAAVLIALTAQKYPARTSEEDLQAAVRIAPELPGPWAMLGSYYRRIGKSAEAQKLVSHAIVLSPGHPFLYEMRWSLRIKAGLLEESLRDIDAALRLAGRWPDYHYDRALTLLQLGRGPEAFQECTTAVELRPGHTGARRLRADFFQKEHRIPEAILEVSAILEQGSPEALDYYNRGVLRLKVREFRPALEDLTRSTDLDPRQADPWRAMGVCKLEMKRFVDAVDDLTRSIELAPLDPQGYLMRARAYADLGDDVHYQADLRRYQELSGKK